MPRNICVHVTAGCSGTSGNQHYLIYITFATGLIDNNIPGGRGDEKVIELAGPGMSFGEASMFLEKPHIVSAETLTDCKLIYVEKEAILDEVRRDPQFAQRVIESLSQRLYQRIMDLESYTLRSGTERVVDYLLGHELSGMFNGTMNITLPVKKGVIASRLNLTHEHFSRILHELMDERLIKVDGRDVRVLDTGRLRAYCAD